MVNTKKMGIIFSNMHDKSLHELTEQRTTSSIPFGARYRFIDFVLSSMVNSGIHSVGVIARNNYESLMDHLGSGRDWDLARKNGGLYLLPPYGNQTAGMYHGRIEALQGMMTYLNRSTAQYVVLSDSDLICNLNFNDIISYHEEKNAEITIAYTKKYLETDRASSSTVFSLNGGGRITDVLVNPAGAGEQNLCLNIMVIERKLLIRLVNEEYSRGHTSFTKDILQKRCGSLEIYGYECSGYISKIDSIKDYFDANMDLLNADVRHNLFLSGRSIYTKVTDQVPTRYGLNSKTSNCFIADGCLIEGEVHNSIISRGVYIGRGAVVRNSVIMNSCRIGENANLDNCILDKFVIVNERRTLIGAETYPTFISKSSIV